MAFFSQGISRYKLMLLFFLKQAQWDLTREQLYRVMVEKDWMNYFDFQTALLELEEDGYVTAVQRPFGQAFSISPEGEQALELFQKQLPLSLRQAMEEYVRQRGEALRCETQYVVRQQRQPDGSSKVELKVLDGADPILELNFFVPTHEAATLACQRWPERAQDVFRDILTRLAMGD